MGLVPGGSLGLSITWTLALRLPRKWPWLMRNGLLKKYDSMAKIRARGIGYCLNEGLATASAGELAASGQREFHLGRPTMSCLRRCVAFCLLVLVSSYQPAQSADRPTAALSDYFPPPEEQGGWRTLLPTAGEPDDSQKARIREVGGVNWDSLKAAWDHNAAAPGATGLLVIRHGQIVGEWYKEGDRTTAFNIYSSSKSYTSTAFGLILSDFGNGPLPGGKTLSLDTKVCNPEWLPESLPLPDPRKAEITVRHLLNMASGLDVQNPPVNDHPFEWSLGHVAGSPMIKLLNDPGAAFHYSNAGVAHLVLAFQRATGEDLYPFLQRRLFEPIGETQLRWKPLGGPGRRRGGDWSVQPGV